MNTRYQWVFFTANLQLQPGIEQMLEQNSYSNDQQANLVPLLIICLCSHWQSWPWLLPLNAPPPISTGAISREQERNVNDFCRHIVECQLVLTIFKRTQGFSAVTMNMSFTAAMLHSASSGLLLPLSSFTLRSACVLLCFSNNHTCNAQTY